MSEIPANEGPSTDAVTTRGVSAAVLPWLLIVIAFNFVSLIMAGFLSNMLAAQQGSLVSYIWWLWLFGLVGSVAFVAWWLSRPSRRSLLHIGPDGITYSRGRRRVAYTWAHISSVTIAPRRGMFSWRSALCLLPVGGLGPEVTFNQSLSPFTITPPFRDASTGWTVVCFTDRFSEPALVIDAAVDRFAGARRRR